MKYGKDKESMKRLNSDLDMEVQILEAVAEERRKDSNLGKKQRKEESKEKKLYLNKILKSLFINPKNRFKHFITRKFTTRLTKWWQKENTTVIKDLVKFVLIHGILGALAALSLLTLTNVNVTLVQYIRQQVVFAIPIYILGTGSFYYLFLDLNKALKDIWGRQGK